jgi:nitrate reductase gamma subunit
MAGVQVATYVLGLIFVVAFAWKVIKYLRMPVHLRWELYPLAGESKRPWGGSYLEEPEWWTKPREEKSFSGEMKFMGREIFFFKEYFDRNRSLWHIVYPFHLGVFLFVGFFVLLLVGALTLRADMAVAGESAPVWGRLVYYLTLVVGVAALVLGTAGSLGLLFRKLVDKTMGPYTRRIEYFNILFVLAIFLTGLISWAAADSTFATARGYVNSLFTFADVAGVNAVIVAHIVLLALFLSYLPFTNMMHFFAKFFTYHMVRWDDKPHLRGSELERKLKPQLQFPLGWSAAHTQSIKHWSDVAKGDVEVDGLGRRVAPKGDD